MMAETFAKTTLLLVAAEHDARGYLVFFWACRKRKGQMCALEAVL